MTASLSGFNTYFTVSGKLARENELEVVGPTSLKRTASLPVTLMADLGTPVNTIVTREFSIAQADTIIIDLQEFKLTTETDAYQDADANDLAFTLLAQVIVEVIDDEGKVVCRVAEFDGEGAGFDERGSFLQGVGDCFVLHWGTGNTVNASSQMRLEEVDGITGSDVRVTLVGYNP